MDFRGQWTGGHGAHSDAWYGVFRPEMLRRRQAAIDSDQSFVYYTTASTALKIIQNNEIWMRHVQVMNDFQELVYAKDCLLTAFQSPLLWLQQQLSVHKWSSDYRDFRNYFDYATRIESAGHVFCLSEFNEESDQLGKLSMWRAYGGGNGVALVFRGRPFIERSEAIPVALTPVEYVTPAQLSDEFRPLWDEVKELMVPPGTNLIDQEWTDFHIKTFIDHCLYTLKHPGFREEMEWRMVFRGETNLVTSSVEVVGGVPQKVNKYPLTDGREYEMPDRSLPSILKYVIVGPSEFPEVVAAALRRELSERHFDDAHSRVRISGIPLRV